MWRSIEPPTGRSPAHRGIHRHVIRLAVPKRMRRTAACPRPRGSIATSDKFCALRKHKIHRIIVATDTRTRSSTLPFIRTPRQRISPRTRHAAGRHSFPNHTYKLAQDGSVRRTLQDLHAEEQRLHRLHLRRGIRRREAVERCDRLGLGELEQRQALAPLGGEPGRRRRVVVM